ncbi:MAG: hypothetical protein ACREH8_16380, partial [Opitutaceae bacterium]
MTFRRPVKRWIRVAVHSSLRREGRLWITANRRVDAQPLVMNEVTIFRTTEFDADGNPVTGVIESEVKGSEWHEHLAHEIEPRRRDASSATGGTP